MKILEKINTDHENEKDNIKKFIVLYLIQFSLFLAVGPWIFSSNWVSSSDFHACIEITSSFIAITAAFACLMYYFGLNSRYYLIIGLGFFICGSEDFIHGILGFERIFINTEIDWATDIKKFIPGTYVAGRSMLAITIIAAATFENKLKSTINVKREAIIFSTIAVIVGGGATALAFSLPLSDFIYPEKIISRPVDFISSILFMIAFIFIFRRFLKRKDIFSGMLLACIIFNIGGQIYMSFSKQLFDVFFDLAHWANIISYCMPVVGITIESLSSLNRAVHEAEEHKRAEEALRESEEKYRELANLLPQTVFELDIEGNFIFTNRYGFESTGYTQEDIEKGINALQLFIPEERENVKENIEKVLSGEEFEDHEYTLLRKDGSTFPGLIYSNAIIHDNKPIGLRGIVLDISERKKDEEALRESEEKFRAISDKAGDAIIMMDNNEKTSFWNKTAENMFGFKSHEIIGQELHKIIVPGHYFADFKKGVVKFKISGRGKITDKTREVTARKKDGAIFPVELSVSAVKLKGKWHAIGIIRDITERKKTEEERIKLINKLQEKTDELNTIIESVGDAILTTDNNYNIIVANKALSEMLGLPEEEIMGKPCSEVLRCIDENGNIICEKECGLKKTIEKGTIAIDRAVIQNPEGKAITIESINSPLKSADGSIIGAVRAIRDISKEAEIDSMKTEFISTVSHELRTPLTPIQGYIDLILKGDTGEINDLQREFLDLVSQNTERLTMLINDLLDIEKIEAGKVSLDIQHVSFSDHIRQAVKTMEPQSNKKGLKLTTDTQENIEGYADPDRLTQILTNLISNAIKFTAEGSITVKLHTEGERVKISVCDTGIGISKSDQKKLFTKFFRAEDAYTRKAGGTGLGLSIVKELVEMHKGEITVKSTLQKGSEFIVILPLKLKKTKKTDNLNT